MIFVQITTHLAIKKLTEDKRYVNYNRLLVNSMFNMKILRYKIVRVSLRKKYPRRDSNTD
ncbi:MAG: hypothetical protein RLZZ71_429 [Bacteroidota bacterium]